ncbi:energy-coupling factor ABC transporter ATP-binding protein [Paramicrobacterium agarici]|uniref:Biotin transport system ATP-binding protein n=1 Tax=Paramicrobacterium agarici TaxID=630514 RepID=A0A2A9DX11_9MICO|nr:ABC transporter ATP-binding protein [Microbacterium agarici]PFG30470.1 biotin transport system ATP-binding protein [Microbacterium agarici]TQO23483.1 biotin transport system ATP-binding protein [Microbacterium agarici]
MLPEHADSEIALSHVTVRHPTASGEVTALHDVSLMTRAHNIAVIGLNGSGKSTFARLLNGLRTPTNGVATVAGLDTVKEARAVRKHVGFVFTNPDAQIVMPTVAEDLAFSLRGRGLSKGQIAERVTAVLAENGLAAHADLPAHDLSGGQKQMLAIQAVLVAEPSMIVADEPTTLLDARNARRIADLLLNLPQQCVIVTHDLELAARCDDALLFDEARLVAHGVPSAVIERYLSEIVARP